MPDDPNALHLLLAHADDHEPALPQGLPDESIAPTGAPKKRTARAAHLWDEGGDPDDLELQRWGVIAPEGEAGDRLLEVVAPLIRLRREQQGGDEVRVYRVPPRMTQVDAARWKKSVFDPGSDLAVELPRYQLILGDLDQVPLALQQVQASDGYVGRLAFDDPAGYEAYVDKVLRWDRRPSEATQGNAVFFSVRDGTRATDLGYDALVTPGVEIVEQRRERGQFPAAEVTELADPFACAPGDLVAAVQGGTPAVLFTLSHGEGAPRGGWSGAEARRRQQGAMSFGHEGHITGEDMASAPFLPGGVWFMLACYGAGTPESSAFYPWLAKLRDAGHFPARLDPILAGLPREGERPFVASLPRAVLANPEGPLAFMGHIDLAWSYAFQELGSGATNRPARFMAILRSALKRDRLGISFRELYRFLEHTNYELTARFDQDARGEGPASAAERAARAHLWMLRQDLAAYILLGDPAVRLPVAGPSVQPSAGSDRTALLGFAPTPAAPAPSGSAITLAVEDLEEAIGQVLVGERGLRAIAREFELEPAQLRQVVDAYRAGGRAALAQRKLL